MLLHVGRTPQRQQTRSKAAQAAVGETRSEAAQAAVLQTLPDAA